MSAFFNLFTPTITKGDNMTPAEREELAKRGNQISVGDPPLSAPKPPLMQTSLVGAQTAAERQRKRAAGGSLLLSKSAGGMQPTATLQPRTLLGS
jgi:hypothetical protein